MMRGASAVALGELSDKLGRTRTLADAGAIGDELFHVASLLRGEPALRRVLADGSVPGQAKVDLATSIFGSSLREDTLAVVSDAVERRWTSSGDLTDGIHQLAAISVVHSAGAQGRTVSDELFAVRQLITANPDLRAALGDLTRTADDRADLLRGIVAANVQDATLRLVQEAVAGDGSVDNALDDYQTLAARVQGARLAVVRTARALEDAEQTRLIEALGKHYGTEVHLHVVVDPELVGGLRVEIGDDVIDGTVANRLDEARRRLVG